MRIGDVAKAAVAGAAAVWVMDRFDWLAFSHEDRQARQRTEAVRPGPGLDPAHALAAKLGSSVGLGFSATHPHRHPAGLAVHYAVPIALTYIYLVSRRRIPSMGAGNGSAYGATCFVLLDQVVNPLLGFAASPRCYPWQRHARELVSHCIYGFIADVALGWLDCGCKRFGRANDVRAEQVVVNST